MALIKFCKQKNFYSLIFLLGHVAKIFNVLKLNMFKIIYIGTSINENNIFLFFKNNLDFKAY